MINENKDPAENFNTYKIPQFLGELALFGLAFDSRGKRIQFI